MGKGCQRVQTPGYNGCAGHCTAAACLFASFVLLSISRPQDRGFTPSHGLVANFTFSGGVGGWVGGWVGGLEAQKKVCVPKIDLQFRAPLINCIFFLRNNFLLQVSGWVRRRSPGYHFPPPHNGKPWPASLNKPA